MRRGQRRDADADAQMVGDRERGRGRRPRRRPEAVLPQPELFDAGVFGRTRGVTELLRGVRVRAEDHADTTHGSTLPRTSDIAAEDSVRAGLRAEPASPPPLAPTPTPTHAHTPTPAPSPRRAARARARARARTTQDFCAATGRDTSPNRGPRPGTPASCPRGGRAQPVHGCRNPARTPPTAETPRRRSTGGVTGAPPAHKGRFRRRAAARRASPRSRVGGIHRPPLPRLPAPPRRRGRRCGRRPRAG